MTIYTFEDAEFVYFTNLGPGSVGVLSARRPKKRGRPSFRLADVSVVPDSAKLVPEDKHNKQVVNLLSKSKAE